VVNELRGEKVDVVQWRENTAQFIAEALGPAKVKEVKVDDEAKVAEVIVSDHQLSLAIGKEGQNARLAARLSGFKVDIRSDRPLVEEEMPPSDGAGAAPEPPTEVPPTEEPEPPLAEEPQVEAEAEDAEATERVQ
jgi:N utilization substance protein A